MSWMPGWKRRKLRVAWEFSTRGILWRLVPSAEALAIEDRDAETKTVSFACVDAASGVVRWHDRKFDEACG